MKKRLLVLLTSTFMSAGIATSIICVSHSSFENGKATDSSEYSVTFTKSSPRTKLNSTTYVFTNKTTSGTDLFLYSYGTGMGTKSPLASMKKDYNENEYCLKFVTAIDGTGDFTFQNITSIKVTTASSSVNGAGFEVVTSVGGSASFTLSSTTPNTEYTINNVAGATYLKIRPTNTNWLDIESLVVYYSCSEHASKTLSSLQLNGGQKEFSVGDTFVFTGTAMAVYENGDNEVVTDKIVVGSVDMSTAGNKTVDISYTENDITVHADFNISVIGYSKSISYKVLNVVTYDYDALENYIDLENSTLPNGCNPGDTVNISLVLKSGVSDLLYVSEEDGKIDDEAFTYDSSSVSFVAPSTYYSGFIIIFYLY